MTEVRMPKPGDAITEATLVELIVGDGELATEGRALYILETDKIDMEIDAPATGVVRWQVDVGGLYDVGTLLAVIE